MNADADYGSHDNVDAVLSSEQHADAVRVDEARVRAYGVPFLVIDGSYRISGAQPADVVLQALEQAPSERPPLTLVNAGRKCTRRVGDSCAG